MVNKFILKLFLLINIGFYLFSYFLSMRYSLFADWYEKLTKRNEEVLHFSKKYKRVVNRYIKKQYEWY